MKRTKMTVLHWKGKGRRSRIGYGNIFRKSASKNENRKGGNIQQSHWTPSARLQAIREEKRHERLSGEPKWSRSHFHLGYVFRNHYASHQTH